MKRTNWLLILLIAAFSTTVSTSCKSKKADTTQDKTTNTSVQINPDVVLRTSVDSVLRTYDGVTADVKDGVITLRGNIKQDEMQSLIMKVQELKPKKVENQLTIKS